MKIHLVVTGDGYTINPGDKLYYLNPYYSSHREFTIPSLPKTFTKAKNNTEDNSIEIPLDGGVIFFTQSSSFFLSTSSDQTKESNVDGNKYPIFLIINDELDINNISNDNTLNLVFKPNNINTIDPFNSIDETNAENMINKIFEDVIKQSNINSLKNRLLAITPSTEKVIFGEVDNSDEHYGKNKLGALSAFLSLAMNYVNYTSCSNGCKDVSELLQQFGFSKINADLIKTYLDEIDKIDYVGYNLEQVSYVPANQPDNVMVSETTNPIGDPELMTILFRQLVNKLLKDHIFSDNSKYPSPNKTIVDGIYHFGDAIKQHLTKIFNVWVSPDSDSGYTELTDHSVGFSVDVEETSCSFGYDSACYSKFFFSETTEHQTLFKFLGRIITDKIPIPQPDGAPLDAHFRKYVNITGDTHDDTIKLLSLVEQALFWYYRRF